ncbi:MAG: hypothetical protein UZ16_OP3001000947 [Candidatus Hinthialibacteria bacterium OLB16]|nr:MAG: hypothetical protein UZ16_OP3001000947 [Candidatus Hinthialibacteria bacterium OLB16]
MGQNPVFADTGRVTGPVKGNGDESYEDIVVANKASDSISVLLNNKSGQFPSTGTLLSTGTGSKPSFVELEDLDNDLYKDLLVVASGNEKILLFINNKASGFNPNPIELPYPVDSPLSAFVGDLNGDSRFDLAIPNTETDQITIVLAGPNGVAGPGVVTTQVPCGIGGLGQLPTYITGGHLNGDINLDLVTPNWEDGTVSVLLGNGDGTFTVNQVIKSGVNTRWAAIADFDGQSGNDLLVVNQGAPQQFPPISGSLIIYFNDGNGGFGSARSLVGVNGPMAAIPTDFDGDGDMDIALINGGIPVPFVNPAIPGNLTIYYNDGTGVFPFRDIFASEGGSTTVGERPVSGCRARLDNTLANDVVVASQSNNQVFIVNIDFIPKSRVYADFNMDQANNSLDLFSYALVFGMRDPRTRAIAELSGDDCLDERDLLTFLSVRNNPIPAILKSAEPLSEIPSSPGSGDRNGDGVVNAADVLMDLE